MFCSLQIRFEWRDEGGNAVIQEYPVFGQSCEDVKLKAHHEVIQKMELAKENSYRNFEFKISDCAYHDSP